MGKEKLETNAEKVIKEKPMKVKKERLPKDKKANKEEDGRKKKRFLTMASTAEGYGQEFVAWKCTLTILIGFGAGMLVGLLFNVTIPYMLVMGLCTLIFTSCIIKNGFRRNYLNQKFADMNQYIEQLLYSFKNERNLLAALKDVYEVFRADSTMKPSMKSAINVIENTFTDRNAYPEELGLSIIEKDFPSQKIRDCHKTLLESQHSGGNPDNVIDILLQDRAIWEKSNALLQKKCQKMKMLVNTACVVTTLLCVVFIRVLMGANMDIDISHNLLVMICTVVMYALDLLVICKSDAKVLFDYNGDGRLGNEDNEKYDKRMLTYYNDIMTYDEQEMWKKSSFRSILPLAVGAGLFIMGFKIAGTVAIGIAALVFFNHRIDYNLKMKALVSEIKIAFPRWLMQIELFIQSNNVYNSLYLSYDEAPEIIKPELQKMLKALDQTPESKQPFLDFFSLFNLTDISSSMLMLYSIQKDVGSAEEQIGNILKKNLAVYEESLDERSDSKMGSMYVLFMIPELTSSGKLLVDMIVFFMVAMSSMSNY